MIEARDALILLHPDDNVLVATRSLPAGTRLRLDGETVVLDRALALGHKLARRALGERDKIIKWGAPIGSLRAPVAPGDWVHMHNMTSDYLASHTRERPASDSSEESSP